MTRIVLDASAILAAIKEENGAEAVQAVARDALASTVNHAEALSKLVRSGESIASARQMCARLSYELVPFDDAQAIECARLVRITYPAGLSLSDRACLALGKLRRLEIMTADRAWTKLRIGVTIRPIR